MVFITAQTIIAFMVNLFLSRYITKKVCENNYMDCNRLTRQVHTRIATPTSVTGCRALPDMTGTRFSIDLEAEVYNFEARSYLVEDVQSSVVEHVSEAPNSRGNHRKMCNWGRFPR